MAFDLDDDELRATRRMNGSDKNVGSIEEDMERCEQLTKLENANWIGLSNQLAIEHLIKGYKELEEENAMLKKVNKITENITTEEIENAIKEANKKFIPVSLVEETIKRKKEYKLKYEQEFADNKDENYFFDINAMDKEIQVLQELLEKRK